MSDNFAFSFAVFVLKEFAFGRGKTKTSSKTLQLQKNFGEVGNGYKNIGAVTKKHVLK